MTDMTQQIEQRTDDCSRRRRSGVARRRRAAEAVIAAYVHEISGRRRAPRAGTPSAAT